MVATNDIGAEVAKLLPGPRMSDLRHYHRFMVSVQKLRNLGEVLIRREAGSTFRVGWSGMRSSSSASEAHLDLPDV